MECFIVIAPSWCRLPNSLHSHKSRADRAAAKARAVIVRNGYRKNAAASFVRVEPRTTRDMAVAVRIPAGRSWSVDL